MIRTVTILRGGKKTTLKVIEEKDDGKLLCKIEGSKDCIVVSESDLITPNQIQLL